MDSFFLPLLLFPLLLLPTHLTAQIGEFSYCYNSPYYGPVGNYTAGSTYQSNLNNVLTKITVASNTATPGNFYSFSSGQDPNRVFGIGLCRGDVMPADCRACITNATRQILAECPNQKAAIGWYDFCMIRYSNQVFTDGAKWIVYWKPVPDPSPFKKELETLLTRLRTELAQSSVRNFATSTASQSFVTIYGLMQCSLDLSRQNCEDCINSVINLIPDYCADRKGALLIFRSCYLMFNMYKFYTEIEAPPPAPMISLVPPAPMISSSSPLPHRLKGDDETSKNNTSRIIAIVVPIAIIVVLCFIIFLFCSRRKVMSIMQRQIQKNTTAGDEISNADGFLQFDFDTIRAATNDFTVGSKLGEGGFGAVYKGTLSNGQEIAVKRLSKNSRQGDLEFKNEVKLVAQLQHKNLVKLLGFCLEGMERLLVYEFVPNASLDHFLFNKDKQEQLGWKMRYKIIGGIVRGLVYLHEDSRLRIIHRDLKASNILLDADMNPKISDFGMAKLFDIDETQANTSRIAGTYGYMAPEYAYSGRFSVKSDVFSFGVLVLEIVSGRRNKNLSHGTRTEDLLSHAWRNWKAGMYSNIVDPSLENVSENEIARCIHIALLCVQETINDRPTMTSVALMLTNNLANLQLPSMPAFFMQTGTAESREHSSSLGYSSTSTSKKTITTSSSSAEVVPPSRNDVSITELYPR